MKVVKLDRGSVEIDIDGKILRVLGEAMMPQPKPHLSEFVIYKNSIKWLNNDVKIPIDNQKILFYLEKELLSRGLKMVVE